MRGITRAINWNVEKYRGNRKSNLCLRDCGFRVRVTGNQIPGKYTIFYSWQNTSYSYYLSTAILTLGKARSRREPNLGCRGSDRPG